MNFYHFLKFTVGKPEVITNWFFSKQRTHELTIVFLWLHGLSVCLRLVLASPLYFLYERSTWHLDSCPPGDTLYGVILWGPRVLSQGLNRSARIFFSRVLSRCYAILASYNNSETAVYGYGYFGVVFMSCKVNFQVVRSALQYSASRIYRNLICLSV